MLPPRRALQGYYAAYVLEDQINTDHKQTTTWNKVQSATWRIFNLSVTLGFKFQLWPRTERGFKFAVPLNFLTMVQCTEAGTERLTTVLD